MRYKSFFLRQRKWCIYGTTLTLIAPSLLQNDFSFKKYCALTAISLLHINYYYFRNTKTFTNV